MAYILNLLKNFYWTCKLYRGADKFLARPTSRCVLIYDMIYLLTASRLPPGGSCTVQYTFTHKQYTDRHKTKIRRTTQNKNTQNNTKDGENISFDANLVIYINSTNIPPIMIINRVYENQNLLSLQLVTFLIRLRTYQHPCKY